jgi:hypothetical protein
MGREVQEAMAGVGGDAEKRGGKGKARGTQPKVTEFFQNKKVRTRTGSGSAAEGQPAEKVRERKQRASTARTQLPSDDTRSNDGDDNVYESGL